MYVRNIQKSSKYYNLEGLIVFDTDKSYYIVWFKLLNPSKKFKNQIFVKERPFLSSMVSKKSVVILTKSELTIPNKNIAIDMAQVEATHLTGGNYRPKKLPKSWQEGTIDDYNDFDKKLLIYK